jgi:hypothetical protein
MFGAVFGGSWSWELELGAVEQAALGGYGALPSSIMELAGSGCYLSPEMAHV